MNYDQDAQRGSSLPEGGDIAPSAPVQGAAEPTAARPTFPDAAFEDNHALLEHLKQLDREWRDYFGIERPR